MPLFNGVEWRASFVRESYVRVQSSEFIISLDEQYPFLYHKINAYFEGTEKQPLHCYSFSPVYALFIAYAPFVAVQLDYRAGHVGEYHEGVGNYALHNIPKSSFVLLPIIGLPDKEYITISEITYPDEKPTLPKLLPTLTL